MRPQLRDIPEALGLLTRLPVRLHGAPRGAGAAWAYPLVGLVVGGLGALVAWGSQGLGLGLALGPQIGAGLALAAMILVTGALHEDGLADTADGLWGGWTRARRLEIMHDSRIGAYGVLALILAMGLRWAALAAVIDAGAFGAIVALAVLSRAAMVGVMAALPNARETGLSAATGRPGSGTGVMACVIGVGLAGPILGWDGLWVGLVLALAVLAVAAIARAKIGGQTGDILGATQLVGESAGYIALAGLIGG